MFSKTQNEENPVQTNTTINVNSFLGSQDGNITESLQKLEAGSRTRLAVFCNQALINSECQGRIYITLKTRNNLTIQVVSTERA